MNILQSVAAVALRRDKGFSLDTDILIPIVIGVVVVIVLIVVFVIILKKRNKNNAYEPNDQYNYDYNQAQPYPQAYDNMNQVYNPIPDYSNQMPVQNYNQPVNNNPYAAFQQTPNVGYTPLNNFENVVNPATPVQSPIPEVVSAANEVTELVTEPSNAGSAKVFVKLVNVQTGATYEAELGEQLTIGKRDCGITIPDDNSISGTHCQIYTYETNYVLADMQSTNGTKLNDYRIETPVFIESGSILGIGKQKFTVTFENK